MKAEIDELGMLTISAETPIEAYALKKWNDDYYKSNNKTDLCIVTGLNNFKD